jgi:hypothetical protein
VENPVNNSASKELNNSIDQPSEKSSVDEEVTSSQTCPVEEGAKSLPTPVSTQPDQQLDIDKCITSSSVPEITNTEICESKSSEIPQSPVNENSIEPGPDMAKSDSSASDKELKPAKVDKKRHSTEMKRSSSKRKKAKKSTERQPDVVMHTPQVREVFLAVEIPTSNKKRRSVSYIDIEHGTPSTSGRRPLTSEKVDSAIGSGCTSPLFPNKVLTPLLASTPYGPQHLNFNFDFNSNYVLSEREKLMKVDQFMELMIQKKVDQLKEQGENMIRTFINQSDEVRKHLLSS